jgi:hypothetical protein
MYPLRSRSHVWSGGDWLDFGSINPLGLCWYSLGKLNG